MEDGITLFDVLKVCSDNAVFLNSWENDFIADLTDRLEDNESYELTDPQLRKLYEIYEKVNTG